jgi:predicted acyltransferase
MMTGNLLPADKSASFKLRWLARAGGAALVLGIALHAAGITPILKWIYTSSYVLVTGGAVLIALAACYSWIDVRSHRRHLAFFTIVGTNSVFIYLFYNFVGSRWLYRFVATPCGGLLQLVSVPTAVGAVASCLVVFGIKWYLCFFLHRRKICFSADRFGKSRRTFRRLRLPVSRFSLPVRWRRLAAWQPPAWSAAQDDVRASPTPAA